MGPEPRVTFMALRKPPFDLVCLLAPGRWKVEDKKDGFGKRGSFLPDRNRKGGCFMMGDGGNGGARLVGIGMGVGWAGGWI